MLDDRDLTYNGLTAFDFLMEYGYLPQHKGIVADQLAFQEALEEWPDEDPHLAEWSHDAGSKDLVSTDVEEVGSGATGGVVSLAEVNFSAEVLKTHERVEKIVFDQYYRKDGMKFLSEWTGRGKTTGVVKALGEIFSRHPKAKVLLVTREMAEVDNLWRTVAATLPEVSCLGWSGVHKGQVTADWGPVRDDVTKKELSDAQLIITTHASGTDKANTYLHKDRDLLLIDEYPDPVSSGMLELGDLVELGKDENYSPKETKAVVVKAIHWATDIWKARPIKDDSWIDDAQTVPFNGDNMKKLHLFAKKYREGKGFLRINGNYKTFIWAEFNLPMEERSVVFSATNAFEGWHLDPKRRLPVNKMVGEPTDYSGLEVTIVRRPVGMKSRQNKTLMAHKDDRGKVLGALRNEISRYDYHNEKVLVLVPKSVADWIKVNASDDPVLRHTNVSLIHWGMGIGTNAFQDHKNMVVWGLFWMVADKLAADAVGHGVSAEDVRNNNSRAIIQQKSNHHSRWIIQMLNRMQIRQMEEGLKAKPGKVVWITTKKEETIIQEVLKKDFRRSVVQSDSDDITTTKPKIVAQVLSYLGTTLMDTATAPEIASERRVDFNQTGVAKILQGHSGDFLEAGWEYVPATRGRHGKPHRWLRAMA
jgi:hypothetical protein